MGISKLSLTVANFMLLNLSSIHYGIAWDVAGSSKPDSRTVLLK